MAGKADVPTHLRERRTVLDGLFGDWASAGVTPSERADALDLYFKDAELGESHRVGDGNSLHIASAHRSAGRPNVLVVGRHGVDGLRPARSQQMGATVTGPGIASRLGPTIAFAEGAIAARAVVGEDAVNMSFLSLGANDTFAGIGGPDLFAGHLDAIIVTNAAAWTPQHPTITTGARGVVVAQLGLDVGGSTDDFATSGALRNPLTTMTHILGKLRNDRGHIALPGFYDRANAPDAGMKTALAQDGHDPSSWTADLGIAKPSGALSSLERAALWPGVSVLSIDADPRDGHTAPSSVTARVAFYLVPDQRYAEVEQGLRQWFSSHAPADSAPTVHIVDAARPYRCSPESVPVAAQSRAAYRIYGRQAIMVPAGGPVGCGELSFAAAAPVAFAGIAPASSSTGTTDEALRWSDFEAGVAMAAETCLQLRRS